MRSSIRLGRLFGIEVGLHYSWFIIALLITMSLGSQFQASHAEWGSNVIWARASRNTTSRPPNEHPLRLPLTAQAL